MEPPITTRQMLEYINAHGTALEPLFFRVGDDVYVPNGLQRLLANKQGLSGFACHLVPRETPANDVSVADFLLWALEIARMEEAVDCPFLLVSGTRTALFTGLPEERPKDDAALSLGDGFLVTLEQWPTVEYAGAR